MELRGVAQDEPDASIVRRVVTGDVEAFELLLDRHGARVRRLVARNVPRSAVPEVAHDAFVAAYLALGSYVPTHPFEHWLTRLALRTCAEFWRARARDGASAAVVGSAALDVALPSTAADDRELCEWALERLEREDREVLSLVYFEGLGMQECAKVLGWSESKVKVRVHRARLRLRRLMESVLAREERRR